MDTLDCDCGGCDGCGDCGGGCDCGDCCAFGAGAAAGAALASSGNNNNSGNTCCNIIGITVTLMVLAGAVLSIMHCSNNRDQVMNNKEAPIARVNKATTGEWKIIEIQKDRRLFGQNHNTLIEHTVSKKRKVVEGVLGKPGEVISL